MKQITFHEIVRVRIVTLPNPISRIREIVRRMPQLNARSEKQPIRARFSERHARAAGIDYAGSAYHPVKLHVRVAADDHLHVQRFKERQEKVFGCETSKDLIFVARRAMAK